MSWMPAVVKGQAWDLEIDIEFLCSAQPSCDHEEIDPHSGL